MFTPRGSLGNSEHACLFSEKPSFCRPMTAQRTAQCTGTGPQEAIKATLQLADVG
jgi:hypothetical protein